MIKKTIVIVDDHILIANALQNVISNYEEFEVIYCCINGSDLIEKLKINPVPDIILLDISMPIMNGYDTALWLRENHPEVLIMTLSMHDDENSLIKMIQNGAKGYMLKNVNPKELENALRGLVQNGSYYPEWATRLLISHMGEKEAPEELTIHLTDREIEFLNYVITDLSYKEIADKMICSPRTIESYRDNLFIKLNVKSRVGLAIFAVKNKIIE